MAKLEAKQRAKLLAKDFGLPEKARSVAAKNRAGPAPRAASGPVLELSFRRHDRVNLAPANLSRRPLYPAHGTTTRSRTDLPGSASRNGATALGQLTQGAATADASAKRRWMPLTPRS